MHNAIRPRRLFVTGGSRMSAQAAVLWRKLGALLANEKGLVVITGGLAARMEDPESLTSDRMIVDGMLPALGSSGIAPEERIETILPDSRQDNRHQNRFKEG